MQNLSQIKEFYDLMKVLDPSDRATIVSARDGGTDEDVMTIIETWQTGHTSALVRDFCALVISARSA